MKFGELISDLFIPKGTLFWMKKDIQRNPFALLKIPLQSIVFDCGSCVGTFAVAAIRNGAKQCICWEPHPKNIEILKENLKLVSPKAILVEKAITCDGRDVHLHTSGFSGAHTITRHLSGKSIRVQSEALNKVLRTYSPNVIKLDIEGAEYEVFGTILKYLPKLDGIFIEFHKHDTRSEFVQILKQALNRHQFSIACDVPRKFCANRIG